MEFAKPHTQIHKLNARNLLHAKEKSKYIHNWHIEILSPWLNFFCQGMTFLHADQLLRLDQEDPMNVHAQQLETLESLRILILSLSLTTLRSISATGPSETRAVTHSHT